MEQTQVKTVSDDLNKYDILAKEHDFITVTEWSNGEGFYIDLNDKQQFSLTRGELDAINYLTKTLLFN
jgi:hypothetical protein